jgi:hypothetical protein
LPERNRGGAGYYRYGFAEGVWIAEDVTDTSYTPAADLGEGAHTLYVQERDDLGNWSASGSFTITVITVSPGGGGGGWCATGGGASPLALVVTLGALALLRRRRGTAPVCVRATAPVCRAGHGTGRRTGRRA